MFNIKEIDYPLHLKNFTSLDLLSIFNKMLLDFQGLEYSKKVRVYKERGVRDDLSILFSNSNFKGLVHDECDLEGALSTLFQSDDFCIAISQLEKHSQQLSDFFAENIIAPWTNENGVQLMGFELYSFLGKYDITPFGIHDDKEHTILVHAGPSDLNVYCWDDNTYRSNVDNNCISYDNFNISPLAQVAEHFILKPNDFLFIPKGVFHVIERNKFSVTLGAIPYPLSGRKIVEKFVLGRLDNMIEQNFPFINAFPNTNDNVDVIHIIDAINDTLQSIDFSKEFLHETLRLKSNRFLINKTETKINDTDIICLGRNNGPIYFDFVDVKIHIFIRGSVLTMNYKPSILTLINKLNDFEDLNKHKIINILLQDFSLLASEKIFLTFKDLI